MKREILAVLSCVLVGSVASAQSNPREMPSFKSITGSFAKKPVAGTRLLAISNDGKASTTTLRGKSFSISPGAAAVRLYLLQDGVVSGQIVLTKCQGSPLSPVRCATRAVYTSFRAGSALGVLTKAGSVYVIKSTGLGTVIPSSKVSATQFVPQGLGNLGLGTPVGGSSYGFAGALADSGDSDQDGLVSAVDIDDDGDGIIDNYDSNSPADPQVSFRVFSNLKLSLDAAINHYTTGLTPARILTALGQQTLAIQVVGSTSETSELDCTGLSYCSPGGTGTLVNSSTPFPGSAGGTFDPDGDGFGTITAGGAASDFQLATHPAVLGAVSAGDTLIQRTSYSVGVGPSRQIAGVLNFVFNSTPGIKSIAVNGGAEQTINYAVTPILGAFTNCIQVPATGSVELEIKGYRPQRPGVTGRGEAEYVNIANSIITIDIPNGPVGSGVMTGPGNCSAGYSTTDPNLVGTASFLRDGVTADYDVVNGSDDTKAFAFKINVTDCLAAASTPITWSTGQELYLDLQFRSKDGDNAATKFCVKRQ